MKGMHNLWDKENTLYQVEDYKGGYLQMYAEDNKYIVEMKTSKTGYYKKFINKEEAEKSYIDLYDKYWR